MNENPFRSKEDVQDDSQPAAKESYNIVADTVTGVNVRWSDNKFQAIFVFVSIVIALLFGAILALLNPRWNLPWYGGALVGSFLGLVFGILASGVFLMFYRAARHLKGKHD
ncbi:MAG: hypothetical protein Aurels2KO_28130 [Aureliella sp.]